MANLPKATGAEREALRNGLRANTADFIRASESRGKSYTLIDEVVFAASVLGLPADPSAEVRAKEAEARAKARPKLEPIHDAPSDSGPNLDPHLTWVPLPPVASTKLIVFADGRLAKLVSTASNHVFVFTSNWNDGPWGARGTQKLSFEAWYRKSTAGAWELDALYPTHWSNIASLSVSSMVDGMAF